MWWKGRRRGAEVCVGKERWSPGVRGGKTDWVQEGRGEEDELGRGREAGRLKREGYREAELREGVVRFDAREGERCWVFLEREEGSMSGRHGRERVLEKGGLVD